jgi:hypothetical protein
VRGVIIYGVEYGLIDDGDDKFYLYIKDGFGPCDGAGDGSEYLVL